MKCASCGADIPDGVRFCPACGAQQPEAPVAPPPPPPPQYSYQAPPPPPPPAAPAFEQPKPKNTGQIVFSIINLFCCTLFGVIALIFAITANSAPTYEEAVKKLKTAKTLNIVGLILGIITYIIIIATSLIPLIIAAVNGGGTFDWGTY